MNVQMIPKHPASQHIEGRSEIREEYCLILANSAEFTSQLAPLAEVDKLDGPGCLNGKVPEQG